MIKVQAADQRIEAPEIAPRIQSTQIGACHLLQLRTPIQSVVSWRGSFRESPSFESGEEWIQDLTVAMLDKGTKHRDRFAIADLLENRGAQLRFSSSGLRIGFSGKALRKDVPDVLKVMFEQLKDPLFDPDEFEKARKRIEASLKRSLDNTRSQASEALSRCLFKKGHPSYRDAEAELEALAHVRLDQLQAYHQSHFGLAEMNLCLVGDLDPNALAPVIEEAVLDWPHTSRQAGFEAHAHAKAPGRTDVFLPDKQNIDVLIGHALPLRRQDPDFLPLYLGTYILGGNFSSRLMSTIRDEQGLTYGIHAGLVGVNTLYDASWRVDVTLSQENLEPGIAATMRQIKQFVEEGVSQAEVSEKKATVIGAFKVGLATTEGLANQLSANAERGFDLDYIDRYPERVDEVMLEEVNEAIPKYIDPANFHQVLAGTIAVE